MTRTNPRNMEETISRYREIYLKRLNGDSIVGAQGHWHMYINDKKEVVFQDIYDGNMLIRKSNRDSVARIFDLIKHPEFKRNHFWSHNTLYGMQYEMKLMLKKDSPYQVLRLSDTVIQTKPCYRIGVKLENMSTRPGFATKPEHDQGSVSKSIYFIDKRSNYPVRIRSEFFNTKNADQKHFIDQYYHDIKFNIKIDAKIIFNTSKESLSGFSIREIVPQ